MPSCTLMSFGRMGSSAALQRKEPVDDGGRTHGKRYQADVGVGHQRWPERQLYEVQPTSGCGCAVSLLRRLLPCRANWRYRPNPPVSFLQSCRTLGPTSFGFCVSEAAVRDHQDPATTGPSRRALKSCQETPTSDSFQATSLKPSLARLGQKPTVVTGSFLAARLVVASPEAITAGTLAAGPSIAGHGRLRGATAAAR
jgi:hypothetical protein